MDLQAEPSTLGPGLLCCWLLFKPVSVRKTCSPRQKKRRRRAGCCAERLCCGIESLVEGGVQRANKDEHQKLQGSVDYAY